MGKKKKKAGGGAGGATADDGVTEPLSDAAPPASLERQDTPRLRPDLNAASGGGLQHTAATTGEVPEANPSEPIAAAPAPTGAEGGDGGVAEEGNDDSGGPESSSTSAAGGGKKKKKKKGGGGAPAVAADAQERYEKVLVQVRSCDADLLWASLSNCAVGDKKLRKLVDAVRTAGARCALTSMDLSMNLFTDAAAATLATALGADGAAPRLLELNLEANPLTSEGIEACRTSLKPRSELVLRLPTAAAGFQDGAIAAGAGGGGGAAKAMTGGGDASDAAFSAYFADALTAAEAAPPETCAPSESTAPGDVSSQQAAEPPMPLEEACAAVLKMAVDGCDALGARALQSLVTRLTDEAKAPHSNPKVLAPAQRWCSKNMPALQGILQKPPRGITARLGRHRLLVVQITAALARAKRPALSTALIETRPSLPRYCLQLMLDDAAPASIMHTILMDLFEEILTGGHKGLRQALLHPPVGDSALPAASTALADALLRPTREQRVARGPLLRLAALVERSAEQDKHLKKLLMADPAWVELAAEQPAMLTKFLEGGLGGPPPARPGSVAAGGNDEANLIAMLQGMGMSSGI